MRVGGGSPLILTGIMYLIQYCIKYMIPVRTYFDRKGSTALEKCLWRNARDLYRLDIPG